MKAEEAIGASRTYVNQTVIGMGAIKGAPCKIKSTTKAAGITTIVFEWKDNEDVTHESTIQIADGVDGHNGLDGSDGEDGFSPTIVVKTSTSSEYILTITDKNGSYDTPNLKGSGGSGATAMSDLTDVDLTTLSDGDALIYDLTTHKWENTPLDIPVSLSDLSDVDTTGITDGQILTWDDTEQKFLPANNTGGGIENIAVNGVAQTVTQGAVDLDVAANLITEAQWTSIQSILV